MIIIAECDYCKGRWFVPPERGDDPALLEGVCGDCQPDRDVDMPLTFSYVLPELPKGWLIEELTDEEAEANEEAEDPRGHYEK